MKAVLRALYRMSTFMATLWTVGPLARLSFLEPLIHGYMRLIGRLVFWSHGGRRLDNVPDMAREWNRMMPAPREKFPVLESDDRTATGAIHVHCPLRGTGDAHACRRLMEFDRTLVEAMGGELVVARSQSREGTGCRVVIRKAGADWSDVRAAHEGT